MLEKHLTTLIVGVVLVILAATNIFMVVEYVSLYNKTLAVSQSQVNMLLKQNQKQEQASTEKSSYTKKNPIHAVDAVYTPASYRGAINYASHLSGVSEQVITNVITQESRFHPTIVSSAGAVGLMQLVPTTGGRFAYKLLTNKNQIPSYKYLSNGWNNIVLGSLYLKYLKAQFSQYPYKIQLGLALASYNWGINNVQYILKLHPVHTFHGFLWELSQYYPVATRNYVTSIMGINTI